MERLRLREEESENWRLMIFSFDDDGVDAHDHDGNDADHADDSC